MRLYSCLFLLFPVIFLSAQEAEIFKFDYTIDSKAFGDERKISVYLPPSYYDRPDEKYTIAFILDGHYDPFVDTGVKILEYFTQNYKITPTIVIGIHAKQRGSEFSSKRAWPEAQSEVLMDHFVNEIIPKIETLDIKANYKERILPYRTLIGHSSGGNYVLDHLFSPYNDSFDAYIAISPGIREEAYYLFQDAEEFLKSNKPINKYLYCSTGTVGDREKLFSSALDSLDKIMQKYDQPGLNYVRETHVGTGHWTCVPASFANGMVGVTRNVRVDEYLFEEFAKNKTLSIEEQVEAFYAEKEKLYGFTELPKARYISIIASAVFNHIDKEKGIEIVAWGLKKYPDDLSLIKKKTLLHIFNKDRTAAALAIEHGRATLESKKQGISESNYQNNVEYFEEMERMMEE